MIIDIQNDFLPSELDEAGRPRYPGGSLAVEGGREIIPKIQKLAKEGQYKDIVASRDWHPEDHCSFVENGGVWPKHCVQGRYGARINRGIMTPINPIVITKGYKKDKDAYSAFDPDAYLALKGSGIVIPLDEYFTLRDIERVDIVGIAFDVCVKATALDCYKIGYETRVIMDLTASVTTEGFDSTAQELTDEGIICTVSEWL